MLLIINIWGARAAEVMLGDLKRAGYDITDDHEESDAIIVNTCAFVEDAKSESLETIMEAAQLRAATEGKKLIVTGCLAQRYSSELAAQLPEVDLVLGFENYKSLPAQLNAVLGHAPAVDMEGVAIESGVTERVAVGEVRP